MPAVRRRRQRRPKQKRTPTDQLLQQTYFNAQHPASFGGIDKLASATNIPPQIVQKWLQQQLSYSLHKPTRYKFPRRKYVSRGLNHQWQADLIEMQKYSRENNGYRYILCAIDIFSRYLYVRPLLSKSGPDVAEAFASIFQETTPPKLLQTDQGLEFYNHHVQRVLERYGVELFSVYSEKKAAIVERVQRTIQERMYRAFTYQGNYKWLTLLPNLVDSYNNSYHRSIKTTPAKVNKKNETDVWLKQYSNLSIHSKAKFNVGERVRISKQKPVFGKGYEEKWSDETFTIDSINTKYDPPLYSLRDEKGEVLKGSFYEQELQTVPANSIHRIEKILRTRTNKGKRQALVKWKGYVEPTWIDYSQIQSVTD